MNGWILFIAVGTKIKKNLLADLNAIIEQSMRAEITLDLSISPPHVCSFSLYRTYSLGFSEHRASLA